MHYWRVPKFFLDKLLWAVIEKQWSFKAYIYACLYVAINGFLGRNEMMKNHIPDIMQCVYIAPENLELLLR
jgi:hypothetical protein